MSGFFETNQKDGSDPDADVLLDSGNLEVNGAATLLPTGDATWTKFTSNVEATLALACEDAGYFRLKAEFAAGTATTVNVPAFLTT